MGLPVIIEKVRYKVAGKYAYKGDLIVTQGIIYYFPHTDLIQQRINRTVKAMSYAVGGVGGAMIRNLQLTDSGSASDQLLGSRDSNSRLQETLDACIADLKKNRASVTLSTYLPIPLRYTQADVKSLSLTFMGSVSFEAHYDTHFYSVGLLRKKLLRTSLTEAGFIT